MAKTTTAGDSRQLRGDLDRLVRRARKVLDKAYFGARSRQVLCRTLALSFLFALPLLLVELVRYVAGYASFGLSGWQYGTAIVAGAGVFALGWLLRDFLRHVLPRGTTLGLFDRQLKLANRLATADEFIATRERTGFMQAAIDDAVGPAARAMGSKAQAIGADRRWPLSRAALLSVPATVCLLLLTIWLGAQERLNVAGELFAGATEDIGASPDLSVGDWLDDEAVREEDRRSDDEQPTGKTPGAELGKATDASVPSPFDSDSFDSSASQPGGQPALLESQSEPSAGQPSGGVPSGADSRPAAQAAGGRQSASGRVSATGERNRNREAGSERERASAQQQAGATQSSGQQSAGQSADSAGSDSAAGGDQSADSGQEGVADSDSSAAPAGSSQSAQIAQQQAANQQAASEVSQSSAGQPRSSEDGQPQQGRGRTEPRQGSDEHEQSRGAPSDQAEQKVQAPGHGGPLSSPGEQQFSGSRGEDRSTSKDAIKKNRGAAKAMLAVPKPDRLVGVRGDGPEQIRQEQSVPQEQQAAPVAASSRSARGERIGTLQQTEVSGWSRQLVRNYFDRGGSATAGVPGETASDTPSTTTNTSEGQQP